MVVHRQFAKIDRHPWTNVSFTRSKGKTTIGTLMFRNNHWTDVWSLYFAPPHQARYKHTTFICCSAIASPTRREERPQLTFDPPPNGCNLWVCMLNPGSFKLPLISAYYYCDIAGVLRTSSDLLPFWLQLPIAVVTICRPRILFLGFHLLKPSRCGKGSWYPATKSKYFTVETLSVLTFGSTI